jgi:hypothetical protein
MQQVEQQKRAATQKQVEAEKALQAGETKAQKALAAEKKKTAAEKKKALAAEKKFQAATKNTQCPTYWRLSTPTRRIERFPTAHPKADFQRLLRASCAPGHRGDPGAGMVSGCRNDPSQKDPSQVVVRYVERVENWQLWQEYTTAKTNMKHRPSGPCLTNKANVSRLVKGERVIDPSVNEYWLWHGTNADTADIIFKQGFDHRVAELNGK